MATYAAMIDCVDQGVGRIVATLDELGIRDNTLIMFLNDNGASPNDRVRRGEFNAPDSSWNMGVAWAFTSNTPLKYYKRTQHSGGVTTPFIANWPAAIKPSKEWMDQPCIIADMMPTLVDLAGTEYPYDFGGGQHPPLAGRSFAPILTSGAMLPSRTLYFSLFNNMAIVDNGWRLVTAYSEPWQLYNLTTDRTETRDLAQSNPERLQEMLDLQKAFFERPDVRLRVNSGEIEPNFAPVFKEDGTIGPGARERTDDPAFSERLAQARSEGREPDAAELEALRKQGAGTAAEPAPRPRRGARAQEAAE
jgi:arylsulfatase A-like enzyme